MIAASDASSVLTTPSAGTTPIAITTTAPTATDRPLRLARVGTRTRSPRRLAAQTATPPADATTNTIRNSVERSRGRDVADGAAWGRDGPSLRGPPVYATKSGAPPPPPLGVAVGVNVGVSVGCTHAGVSVAVLP